MMYNKYFKNLILPVFVLSTISFSCVSSKKYEAALDDMARMKKDSLVIANELATVKYNASKELLLTKEELKFKNERLDSLKSLLSRKQNKIDGIKTKLMKAFPNVAENDVNTYVEDGYVHLELDHRVLFNRGEKSLTSDGHAIISKISNILKNADSDVMVLGHTDSLPIYSSVKNNWDLSISRAQSVMEILVKNGVNPERIIVAGRSKFDPMLDNQTQIGRLLNRRIELVLMPDMEEVESLYTEYIDQ